MQRQMTDTQWKSDGPMNEPKNKWKSQWRVIDSHWLSPVVSHSSGWISDLGQVYWTVNTHLMGQHLTLPKKTLSIQSVNHMYWVSCYFSSPNSISWLSWHVLGVSETNLVSIHLMISCTVHNSKRISFHVPLLLAAADIYSLPSSPFSSILAKLCIQPLLPKHTDFLYLFLSLCNLQIVLLDLPHSPVFVFQQILFHFINLHSLNILHFSPLQ